MNKYILRIFFIASLFTAGACSDFGDINIDPNNPSTPNTAALLTSALRSIPGVITATQPAEYVQHITQKYYTDSSRYGGADFSYNGFYSGALTDLQEIINLNSDPETAGEHLGNGSNQNQIAIAQILQAWNFWIMTDAWGDIPYTQALQGRENFRPAFDDQSAIYSDLFAKLKSAASSIDENSFIEGDILFNGDLSMWKKFANSIRMVMALRLSEVDAAKGQTEFNSAMNDGVFGEGEHAIYFHLTDQNNDNPWDDRFETREDWCVSKPFMDYLKATNDPRIPRFGNPAANTLTYEGMPYGLAQDDAGNITPGEVSFVGDYVRRQDAPTFILVHPQILFSMAEAAHLGWIGGGDAMAEQYFNDAVKASWQQWDVYDETEFNAFIAQDMVKYDPANAIKSIHYQKWVALYLNGYESWSEWRRTGYPELTPAPDPLNQFGGIPVRYDYPTTERDLNGANYQAQVSKMGEDEQNIPVWWDK